MDELLALRFASTIRARRTGLTDALATPDGVTAWVAEQDLTPYAGAGEFVADEVTAARIVGLRQAVRALFAKAVAPEPPSRADAGMLPPFEEALETVNGAAAPLVRRIGWRDGWEARAEPVVVGAAARVGAALADAAIAFFSADLVEQVRVCPAPRCVLYFVKKHPRQEWCSVACGNRARAARFYHQER